MFLRIGVVNAFGIADWVSSSDYSELLRQRRRRLRQSTLRGEGPAGWRPRHERRPGAASERSALTSGTCYRILRARLDAAVVVADLAGARVAPLGASGSRVLANLGYFLKRCSEPYGRQLRLPTSPACSLGRAKSTDREGAAGALAVLAEAEPSRCK
jgi:hypothetical protein